MAMVGLLLAPAPGDWERCLAVTLELMLPRWMSPLFPPLVEEVADQRSGAREPQDPHDRCSSPGRPALALEGASEWED